MQPLVVVGPVAACAGAPPVSISGATARAEVVSAAARTGRRFIGDPQVSRSKKLPMGQRVGVRTVTSGAGAPGRLASESGHQFATSVLRAAPSPKLSGRLEPPHDWRGG